MRVLMGEAVGDGFIGGVGDAPAVRGGVCGEEFAGFVEGIARGTPGERREPGVPCAFPSDPDGTSGPPALVPEHGGVLVVVVLAEFTEDVSGFGAVSGDGQGDDVVRGWEEGDGGALVRGWGPPRRSSVVPSGTRVSRRLRTVTPPSEANRCLSDTVTSAA